MFQPAALILSTILAQASAPVLESPQDYEVFQRHSRAGGTIVVNGSGAAGCDRAEARLDGGKWSRVELDKSSGAFHGDLAAAAGGWYRVDVRLLRRGKLVAQLGTPHVGVGEVFVVAGQSNATNYGEIAQKTQSRMVAALGQEGWSIADDPQPGVQDNSKKGSFIPAFGDAMYARYHVPIGVAAVGHGSTSVRQWLPKGDRFSVPPTMPKFVRSAGPGVWECDGQLFDGMRKAIRKLGPGGFRALLWHQGESDANQAPGHEISADEYRRLLERVIRASREQAGWNFPWFVAQASYHTPDDASSPALREAQRAVWQSGLAFEGPDTDRLTGSYRQNQGRGVHLSESGLRAHGELWADKVGAYVDSVLK